MALTETESFGDAVNMMLEKYYVDFQACKADVQSKLKNSEYRIESNLIN